MRDKQTTPEEELNQLVAKEGEWYACQVADAWQEFAEALTQLTELGAIRWRPTRNGVVGIDMKISVQPGVVVHIDIDGESVNGFKRFYGLEDVIVGCRNVGGQHPAEV